MKYLRWNVHMHNLKIHLFPKKKNWLSDEEGGLKSSYGDLISAVDDFLDQEDPSTATLMKEVCGPQEGLC